MTEPKWQTPKMKIVGWITFGLFLLPVIATITFALIDKYITDFPTISNYVSARAKDQAPFMWICIGILAGLAVHWFWGAFKKKYLD